MSKMDTFRVDKKAETGSLMAVECTFAKFSGYRVETLPTLHTQRGTEKDVDVVIGDNAPSFALNTILLEKDILFEALSLARNVDTDEGFNRNTLNAIPTNAILSLCQKYGLLDHATFDSIWAQYRKPGFMLHLFKHQLFALHSRFAVYRAVLYEDYKAIRALDPDIKLRERNLGKRLSDDEALTAAKEWLAHWTIPGPGLKTSLRYDRKSDSFVLVSRANDFLEACDIFLSLMIASDEIEGSNLKVCANENCRSYFVGHGNAKYCPNCNRKTVWSRKKRDEERRNQNGKKTKG
jgi:hypothetical protein